MRRILQFAACVLAVAALVAWMATGANRGWTKTTDEIKTLDEITGIEGIEYRKAFRPGLDFLGGAVLGAVALVGASFFVRKQTLRKS